MAIYQPQPQAVAIQPTCSQAGVVHGSQSSTNTWCGGDGTARCEDPRRLVSTRRAVVFGQQHRAGALQVVLPSDSFRGERTACCGGVVADARSWRDDGMGWLRLCETFRGLGCSAQDRR